MSPDMHLCPIEIRETLARYVRDGVPTGGFCRAVLAHDLFEAVGRADHINLPALPHIVMYIYNELPATCHGSYGIVDKWLDDKMMDRVTKNVEAVTP